MRRCFGPIVVALLILGQAGCSTPKKDTGESTSQKSPDEIAAMMVGPPFPYPLDHWTDGEEAREKGESALYQNALLRQANSLNALSTQELCARVLRFMDALEEETQWLARIDRFISSDAVRKPLDAAVFKSWHRLDMLVVLACMDLKSNLDYATKPDHDSFWQEQLRVTIVRIEKELPIIQRGRRALVEMLAREIPKLPADSEWWRIKDIKTAKTLAMRGAAASDNDFTSPPRSSNAAPIYPITVPRGANGVFSEYNQFPSSLAEASCRLNINLVRASAPTETMSGDRWNADGVITAVKDDITVDASLSGALLLLRDETSATPRWCIQAGTLEITVVGAAIARLDLLGEKDNESAITLDENGEGWFIALFNAEYSPGPWHLAYPFWYRLKLPVTLNGNSLVIHLPTTRVSDLATYQPRATSDFNRDGILEYGSDFAAYLRDFDLHTPLADMNGDGQWDARDIDLWLVTFWEDHEASWRRPD